MDQLDWKTIIEIDFIVSTNKYVVKDVHEFNSFKNSVEKRVRQGSSPITKIIQHIIREFNEEG